MRMFYGKKSYLPIGYKLLLTYLLLVAIPVAAIGIFAYATSIHSASERTKTNLQGTLQQMSDNITLKMGEVKRVSDQLYYDTNLQKIIRESPDNTYELYNTVENQLKPALNYALNLSSQKLLLALYVDNEALPQLNESLANRPLEQRLGSKYILEQLNNAKEWYNTDDMPDYDLKWTQVESDRQYGNWSLMRKVLDVKQGFMEVGLIRVIVSKAELFGAVDYVKIGSGAQLYITDERNERMFSSLDKQEQGGLREQNDKDYIRIEAPIAGFNGTLVALLPKQELRREAQGIAEMTIWLCSISLLAVTVAAILLSRYFSRRVGKIISSLAAFREGNFHKRIHFGGRDEFVEISESFNEMAARVNQLIEDVYKANIKQKEYELEVLQAQINPHFLYNTLSSISRLAKLGKVEPLHQMILGLGKFYRLTFNEGRTFIPVEVEIQQALAYLDIQSIKYGDQIKLYVDVDESVYGYETIKIILQPYLENIFKHAMPEDKIAIRLVAYMEQEHIHFKIIDNGIGMSAAKADEVMFGSDDKSGGIRNVDRRIRLHYGEEYRVRISSGRGIGCGIGIRIPAKVR